MASLNNGEAFAALVQRWKEQPKGNSRPNTNLGLSSQTRPSSKVTNQHKSNRNSNCATQSNYQPQTFNSNQTLIANPSRFEKQPIVANAYAHLNGSEYNPCGSESIPSYQSYESLLYCEPCDKELLAAAFSAHMATHEKCSHPGCTFSATKKVLSAHFHATHGTYSGSGFKTITVENQSFTVLLGSDPDEIEQWKAERRRKFPSAANIRLKNEQRENLIEAGAILQRNKYSIQNKKRPRESQSPNTDIVEPIKEKALCLGESINEESSRQNDSQEDYKTQEILPASANDNVKFPHKMCNNFLRGYCKRGKNCHFLHDKKDSLQQVPFRVTSHENVKRSKPSNINMPNIENTRSGKKKDGLFLPEPLNGGRNGTLLQHLLKDSIQREQDLILQSLRYIVQNNFFNSSKELDSSAQSENRL